MFVVDLMHEVELGTWKHLFIHLLRILDAKDPSLLYEVDSRLAPVTISADYCINYFFSRFRKVPSFGCDTIRRFSSNTSEMKKLAARDFEDILQVKPQYISNWPSTNPDLLKCAIPVFEGLLPECHNAIVMRLLFLCAHWHGLAKLRLHTDITLGIMDRLTTELGQALRDFEDKVCTGYATRELPRETAARERRQQAKGPDPPEELQPRTNLGPPRIAELPKGKNAEPKRLVKALNLQTYKHHSLGDYVDAIRQYGTTDSYSTELVCFFIALASSPTDSHRI